jgi:biopolymer transport protein ExbD
MAGGARGGDDEGLITEINVTPLVDVVLVLLIILMVTATAIVRNETIPVELPEASTGQASQDPTTLPVSISKEGTIYLEDTALTLEQLREKAAAAHAADPETRAILHADGRIPHADVVRVIDVLRQAEVTKFAINVKPSDLEAQPAE